MDFYRLVLFLHVAAAVVLAGSALFAPLSRAAVRRAATIWELRRALAFARDAVRVNPLAALVLLATGLYLAAGRWSEAWLVAGAALYVASAAVAVGIEKPAMARVAAAAPPSADGPVPASVDAARDSPAWDLATDALLANNVGAFFLMTYQPGPATSAATVAACAAAVLVARGMRRSARRQAAEAPITSLGE